MEKIRKFLVDKGYEFWDENVLDGRNEYLRIRVSKRQDGKYIVDNAIMCFFDRWANSGVEHVFDTEDEVINYFETPWKCLQDAISELTETIIEDAEFDKDYSKVDKMIDFLHGLIYIE